MFLHLHLSPRTNFPALLVRVAKCIVFLSHELSLGCRNLAMTAVCSIKKMEQKDIEDSYSTLCFSSIALNTFVVNYSCNCMFIILSPSKPDCKFLEDKNHVCFSTVSSVCGTEPRMRLEFDECGMMNE